MLRWAPLLHLSLHQDKYPQFRATPISANSHLASRNTESTYCICNMIEGWTTYMLGDFCGKYEEYRNISRTPARKMCYAWTRNW